MQLQNQSCASATPLALIAGLQAQQPPREQRLNRASRGLSSQFIVCASRRLKSQTLEGASRRLNSQSVSVATTPLQLSGWLPAEPANVLPALTGRSKSWCSRAVLSGKLGPGLPPGTPPALPNPYSTGAPTAGHQARSGGTRYIFASPGLASCRRRPVSSNVRQHKAAAAKSRKAAAAAKEPSPVRRAPRRSAAERHTAPARRTALGTRGCHSAQSIELTRPFLLNLQCVSEEQKS